MGTFLRKLYTKKETKLSGSFWEINILSEKLTTDDDGRRRTTTDESALEKLRCLSAGGAKKKLHNTIHLGSTSLQLNDINTYGRMG